MEASTVCSTAQPDADGSATAAGPGAAGGGAGSAPGAAPRRSRARTVDARSVTRITEAAAVAAVEAFYGPAARQDAAASHASHVVR